MNPTDFSIHFTIKNQDLEALKEKFNEYKHGHTLLDSLDLGDACLHHCFLPRETVIVKCFSEDVVDFLDEVSPRQVRWYGACHDLNDSRREMLINLKKVKGFAIFLGDIKEGVAEELKLAQQIGVGLLFIP